MSEVESDCDIEKHVSAASVRAEKLQVSCKCAEKEVRQRRMPANSWLSSYIGNTYIKTMRRWEMKQFE